MSKQQESDRIAQLEQEIERRKAREMAFRDRLVALNRRITDTRAMLHTRGLSSDDLVHALVLTSRDLSQITDEMLI